MLPGLLLLMIAADPAAADTVVVCPPQFRAALQPWLELRREQGHQVSILDNGGTADDVRTRVRTVAAGGRRRSRWSRTTVR